MIMTVFNSLVLTLGALWSTWREPWHEDVIRGSHCLVRAEVVGAGDVTARFRLIRRIAGADVAPVFEVSGYWRLALMSATMRGGIAAGTELPFRQGSTYYLFLRWSPQERLWRIPTPTCGWDRPQGEEVVATFRRSDARCLLDATIYETMQAALFDRLHGRPHEEEPVRDFIVASLKGGPVDEQPYGNRFYTQHAALEMMRHFPGEGDAMLLEPFVLSSDMNVALSAMRALSGRPGESVDSRLVDLITTEGSGLVRSEAVEELARRDARSMAERLRAWLREGEDQGVERTLSIMDPRIGTYGASSVRSAVAHLLRRWR